MRLRDWWLRGEGLGGWGAGELRGWSPVGLENSVVAGIGS